MVSIRRSGERGHLNHGWLDTHHTFSFGQYRDPEHTHFRALRVINEDTIGPGRGFGSHPHDNMEILTWVLSGELAHTDSLGHQRTLTPGEMQRMSAGSGIQHSEYNASKTEPVRLLQIWILPGTDHAPPAYGQTAFDAAGRRNRLQLVASGAGEDGSLSLNQDARVYVAGLAPGMSVDLPLRERRSAWVQVAKGSVTVNGQALGQGDAAALTDEASVRISGTSEAQVLVFDLA